MLSISHYQKIAEEKLWCVERRTLSKPTSFMFAMGRVAHLSWKRCAEHQIFLRASALTLFTLLALVPVLATLFGIAKGFGLAELVESEIREAFSSQEQVMTMLVSFSKKSLEHAKGGVIAGIGILILLWTVIRMVGNVEAAFNIIWGVRKHRSLLRRFTDYLFLIVLLPLLLVFSSSATVALTAGIHEVLTELGFPPDAVALILISAQWIPAILLGFGFAFLYAFLPNTRVQPFAATVGGMTAAVAFLLSQWLYVQFQFALSSYGAIYGSFAALPLFLIWLQAAWVLVLSGAELSRAIELRDEFEFEPHTRELSIQALFDTSGQIGEALRIQMENGNGAPTLEELAKKIALPKGIVRSACDKLQQANILTLDENSRWVPLVVSSKLNEKDLVELVKAAGRSLPAT